MKSLIVLTVVCLVGVSVTGVKLPADFPRCHSGDTVCLQRVITDIVHKYPKGLPSINLPSLDPFHITSMDIIQGEDRPIAIKLYFKNLDFTGLSHGKVTKIVGFERDPNKSKFEVYVSVPKIEMVGDYKIDGKVLVLPIQGTGKSRLTLDNVDMSAKLQLKVTTKNGKTYVQIDKSKLNIEATKMSVQLTNLFNGDKALGDNMNLFLNENWKDIFNELKPSISEAMLKILENIINGMFSKLSYDEIWLE